MDSIKGASVDELEVLTVAMNRKQATVMGTYIRQALQEKRNPTEGERSEFWFTTPMELLIEE